MGHRFSFSSHLSMHLEWYSCGHFGNFLNFWYFSKLSKQIEHASSAVSLLRIHTISLIDLISDWVRPLLTLPFLSSSSISCSYVMLSVSGLLGSASPRLASIAYCRSRSSSASTPFCPIKLFIIVIMTIYFSLSIISRLCICIASIISF